MNCAIAQANHDVTHMTRIAMRTITKKKPNVRR
jgi:hypothetical protein